MLPADTHFASLSLSLSLCFPFSRCVFCGPACITAICNKEHKDKRTSFPPFILSIGKAGQKKDLKRQENNMATFSTSSVSSVRAESKAREAEEKRIQARYGLCCN